MRVGLGAQRQRLAFLDARKLNKPSPLFSTGDLMKYKFKPGDVLHLQKDIGGDNPKGANYLILGYDLFCNHYIALGLRADSILPYSMITNVFHGKNIVTKLGEVDLKQVPANLEDLVDFAAEDADEKWTNPPELEHLKNCDVLKQYVL